MAVYKEEKTGTWRAVYRYTDWNGERKQTQKRDVYKRQWHDSAEATTNALIGLYDQYPNTVEDAVIFFDVID